MLEIRVSELTEYDVEEIATTARDIDKEEIWLQTGQDLDEALSDAIDFSSESWAGFVDYELVVIFGVSVGSIKDGIGIPWLIGTDQIEDVSVPFLRRGWYYLNRMKSSYDILQNVVYDKNVIAKRWLNWMGFEMGSVIEYGRHRAPFRRFEWRA